MAEYTYTKAPGYFKASLLMDEMLATFPELTEGEGDERRCLLFLESAPDGSRVTVTVPDEVNAAAIDALVEAHDSTLLSQTEQAAEAQQTAAGQVNAADVGTILQGAAIADTVADLREQVMALAQLIGNLAVAEGYTPVVEEA